MGAVPPEVARPKKGPTCNHEDPYSFVLETVAGYFADNYLNENDTAVRACCVCNKNFRDATAPKVYQCSVAALVESDCMRAYCSDCYLKWAKEVNAKQKEQGIVNTRPKRSRN